LGKTDAPGLGEKWGELRVQRVGRKTRETVESTILFFFVKSGRYLSATIYVSVVRNTE
jgi:hypothetical protein